MNKSESEVDSTMPRIALVYDRVNKYGGAERVLQFLHTLFPDAPLYTAIYDPKGAPWADGWNVIPSFLQRIPFLRRHHELLGMFMPIVFESFDFSMFDIVISVTSEAAKGIITKPETKHICYLLTPTRYLWVKPKEYERDYYGGWKMVLLPFHRLFLAYLQWWDRVAAFRPDSIVPISEVVRKRCEVIYKRKTEPVIYPPIDLALFSMKVGVTPPFNSFYLCVTRLVPYKRVDLAIRACKKTGKNLVIIGVGSDEDRLRDIAGKAVNIFFAGHLTDEELVGYYQQCTGLLFPGEEDFGLTAIEA
ncbi:MAG TPA: glycosyltransferase, partial [Patescibacteria group bacterium]|nr:glycosyltransferase [Patescibacteria group bacterium]